MGSRSLRDKRKRVSQHQRAKDKKASATGVEGADGPQVASEPTVLAAVAGEGALPDCVRKLFVADYGEIEEGCSDVALFALDPETHASLLPLGVPQRLMQLLCLSPFDPATVQAAMASSSQTDAAATAATSATSAPLVNVHKGILFFQIAAAQALRNLITNSEHDEAIDMLEKASSGSTNRASLLPASAVLHALQESAPLHTPVPPHGPEHDAAVAALRRRLDLGAIAQMDLASTLVMLVTQASELAQVALQRTNPADLMAEASAQQAEADGEGERLGQAVDCDGEGLSEEQKHAIEQAMGGLGAGSASSALAAAAAHTDASSPSSSSRAQQQRSSLYFVLLSYLDELLQLVSVCVESNERVAEYWSEAPIVCWCLDTLHSAHTVVMGNVHHTAAYYTALLESPEAAAAQGPEAVQRVELHAALRFFKRRETDLCGSLLVAGSELLQILSTDNNTVAALLCGGGGSGKDQKRSAKTRTATPAVALSESQQAFLNSVTSGNGALDALTSVVSDVDRILLTLLTDPQSLAALASESSAETLEPEQDGTRLRLGYHGVVYQLLQFTLSIHATLLNVASGNENIAKALPLVVSVLEHTLPVRLWRTIALPLMSTTCALREPIRKAALDVVSQRLRCVHGAVKVLHTAVSWVCEQNRPGEEDEVAFAKNPSAALLHKSNALYVFGLLLKDVLWMSADDSDASAAAAGGGRGGAADVMHSEQMRRDQHALRDGVAGSISGEVSAVQFSILSTEVAVWGVSNALLLMVPATQLGDQPSLIWRAMVDAVRVRHALLLDAATAAEATTHDTVVSAEGEVRRGMLTRSPAARHMLWLQLESIVQMLWTLQRKQANAFGGPLESVNQLAAEPADVDLLTRLAWESHASPALQQSSVGTVVRVCCSLQTAEAVAVATRFVVAMMTSASSSVVMAAVGPSASPSSGLPALSAPWLSQSAPTDPTERHAWLAGLTALDGVVSVRCEAANALVDVFSDERYDATVYVPLGVHAALQSLLPQVRGYVKRRIQLTRDLQRNYRVVAAPVDVDQWEELCENLDGFLEYKRQNVR